MKRIRNFIIPLLALLVTLGIIMFPKAYYAVFDRNIEASDPVRGVHSFENPGGELTPTQVYKLFSEGGALIADTPLVNSFDGADDLTREALKNLENSFSAKNCFTDEILRFMGFESIESYCLTTYCGVVDSQPVTLTLLGAQGKVDEVQYTVTIDVDTGTVYDFSVSAGMITDMYYYDEETAKEVASDLASYWDISGEDICDKICLEVIPPAFFYFSLIDTNRFYTESIQD
ncbi:MAG: hypothetical protein Q4D44_00945 [Eubacteriales bacterium]|nr:hypothetical protein [Eubacteriales bacterium]